jgi:peptide/nickel transport system ATP-binding protein/oligopeptide transport system ATP-binding protein
MSANETAEVVLSVDNIVTRFNTAEGTVHAVNGVSFDVRAGELLGVVGESGCGKSVTMMSLVKLVPMPPAKIVAGSAMFDQKDLIQMDLDELQKIRGGQIGFIFQDPMTSLNPVLTVGYQLTEALRLHKGLSKKAARAKAVKILELVGIPLAEKRLDDFPHQFSGGMRQRVMIAIALSCDPKVLIADEPTTALDVTIQAQILDLVKRLRQELGMAIVWVTHDLGVVASLADRVMVMYSGFVVERAEVKRLYAEPKHPYTMALLATLPELEGERATRLESIEGQPPDQLQSPTSCPFAPRCAYAFDRCAQDNPLLKDVSLGHEVACWWDVEEDRPRDYN